MQVRDIKQKIITAFCVYSVCSLLTIILPRQFASAIVGVAGVSVIALAVVFSGMSYLLDVSDINIAKPLYVELTEEYTMKQYLATWFKKHIKTLLFSIGYIYALVTEPERIYWVLKNIPIPSFYHLLPSNILTGVGLLLIFFFLDGLTVALKQRKRMVWILSAIIFAFCLPLYALVGLTGIIALGRLYVRAISFIGTGIVSHAFSTTQQIIGVIVFITIVGVLIAIIGKRASVYEG